jgi:pilus assembly protein CpaB
MLLAALAAGVVAVLLAARWMQGQAGEHGRIAVAHADIPIGSRLTPQMLRLAEWPRASVPAGAFTTLDALDGRVVTAALLRGEPLTESRLAPVGARAGLSAVVPEGKRAMTVRVNDVVGVAGFALPGTFVDVLVNTQNEGARRGDADRAISKIVLERILVLAVAQESDRDASKPKVVSAVTLELTPAQAERLDLARSVGTLSLVLRNQTDPQSAATDGATKAELLGLAAARPAEPPARPRAAPAPRLRPAPDASPPPAPAPAPAPAAVKVDLPPPRHCVEIVAGPVRRTECF